MLSTSTSMLHDLHPVPNSTQVARANFFKPSPVTGLTLPLVDIETSLCLALLLPCFMIFILCRIPRKWLEPIFSNPLPSPALHYRWLTLRLSLCLALLLPCFMIIILSTVKETNHQFLELLYLVTGLTLQLVDNDPSHSYYFFSAP